MAVLKKYLRILTPDAFPNVLKWTAYPVNMAQKQLYSQFMALPSTPAAVADAAIHAGQHYHMELISMFDRCTAVAFTGSMKVIPRKLGMLMWFGSAVHAGLLPCFNPDVVNFEATQNSDELVIINAKHWPRDQSTGRPLQSSSRTHEVEYGVAFKEVCMISIQNAKRASEPRYVVNKLVATL
jgi:hypothetical protein